MHERQTALTGPILALMLLVAMPSRAEKDAAMKAREGEINHWIEYYRKNRQQAPSVAPASQDTAGRSKEKCEKGKGDAEEAKKCRD